MDLREKIIFTIIFLIAGFIVPKMSNWSNDLLKSRLQQSNPDLVKNQYWFFSDTKKQIINVVFKIMVVIAIVLMWTSNNSFID